MKYLLIVLLLPVTGVFATGYYVSVSGNNSNLGIDPNYPLKTIEKVNSMTFADGDVIAFKAGDKFFGSLKVSRSYLTFTRYGAGVDPCISGLTMVSMFDNVRPGVWQSTAALTNVKNKVNLLLLDNVPQSVCRWPNVVDSTGYITWTAFNGRNSVTAAPLNGQNFTGAEVVIAKEGYVRERNRITEHTGAIITYTPAEIINPRNGPKLPELPSSANYGLFLQRHVSFLDSYGEWFFDSTSKKLSVYFGTQNPDDHSVQIANVDTLVNIGNRTNITIDHLILEGAGMAAVYFQDSRNITVSNCTILSSGAKGIFGWNTPNTLVKGNAINYALQNAIDITGRYASNVTVYSNKVSNTGMLHGMGSFYDDADYKGIYVAVDSFGIVRKNIVLNTGYVAIQYQGSRFLIDSNFVDSFDLVKEDGGGIYTYSGGNAYGRIVSDNIVLHAIGNCSGNKKSNGPHAELIYTDGCAKGIEIFRNTVAYGTNKGFHLNDPHNVYIHDNIVYSANPWSRSKHDECISTSFIMKNNVFFAKKQISDHIHMNYSLKSAYAPVSSNIQQSLSQIGVVDSNFYNIPSDTAFGWYWFDSTNSGLNYMQPRDFKSFIYYKSFAAPMDANSTATRYLSGDTLCYNASDTILIVRFQGLRKRGYPDNSVFNDSAAILPFRSRIFINSGYSNTISLPINGAVRVRMRLRY